LTSDDFRRLALSLPETTEGAHMGHADFRVAGKIFATLGYPRAGWGMVKLTPEQQAFIIRAAPRAFVPVKGAWGQGGATSVQLRSARKGVVREALMNAWQNRAPRSLLKGAKKT
jgi:hypothetical protein